MDTRFAEALHAEEHGFQAGRLRGEGSPDAGPPVAVDEARDLVGPIPREGLDGPLGNAALLRCPGRGLRQAVFFAEHISLELLEPVGMGGDVLLVVRPFGDPYIGDGQVEGCVGVRQDWYPLVRVDSLRRS